MSHESDAPAPAGTAAPTRGSVISWAMYDWANSAFATTIMAGFFPVFYKEYWCKDIEATTSTLYLGIVNSVASLLVAMMAPVLGSIADAGARKKQFLGLFTVIGVLASAALVIPGAGRYELAGIIYGLAIIGFAASLIFYDSLLVDVADPKTSDQVSALGYALGYLGGGLLFALNVTMTLRPAWFGLEDSAAAVRVSFATVAIWWAVFSLPVFLFVRQRYVQGEAERRRMFEAVRAGIAQLKSTFRELRRLRTPLIFLGAYWLYIDGVDTVIRMAVDYGMSLGFRSESLIVALLIVQFVGFPAAIAFGYVGKYLGTKTGIYIALVVYAGVTVWGYFLQSETQFYYMAIAIGLVQGGVQSLSRSFYSRLIPPEKSAEFFGFYNMLGKFAAIMGPVLMGVVGYATGNPRLSILSLLILFAGGAILLAFVKDPRNHTTT